MARKRTQAHQFFDTLEVGDTFRFNSFWEHDGERHDNWIYCVFRGFNKAGKPTYTMWDQRFGPYYSTWDSNRDRKITDFEKVPILVTYEHESNPVFACSAREEEPELAGLTMGEAVGTQWVNRWTYHLITVDRVDLNRFGEPTLYYKSGERLDFEWSLGYWHGERYIVYDWSRYDSMTYEEKLEIVKARIARAAAKTRSTGDSGSPSPGAVKQLEKARQMYAELTGHDLVSQEVLNAGANPGDQLSLF